MLVILLLANLPTWQLVYLPPALNAETAFRVAAPDSARPSTFVHTAITASVSCHREFQRENVMGQLTRILHLNGRGRTGTCGEVWIEGSRGHRTCIEAAMVPLGPSFVRDV